MSRELIIASWCVAGVAAFLGRALGALAPIAAEIFDAGALTGLQWMLLVAWVTLNAYAEGYRGFHRSFSPRVVERAFHLGRNPSPMRVLLGAPYSMGLFDAPRRIVVTSWLLLLGIVLLVIWVRRLAQPWRGIVDAGVVVGLGLGLLSILLLFVRRAAKRWSGPARGE
ncbi:MAG TPA: hypothetical protein VEK15_13385 [Vicinamibacteria bacterium]|nr:hypothetical protein [Vicinamibacteria bacterium]